MKIPNFLTKEEQEVIFLIKHGINYATAIAKERKVESSPQLKCLRNMEKKGLLSSKKEKYLNKTIFRCRIESTESK